MSRRARARMILVALVGLVAASAALVAMILNESSLPPEDRAMTRIWWRLADRVGRRMDRLLYSAPEGGAGAVFLHHSCGRDWLASGLDAVMRERHSPAGCVSITYGTDLEPDPGRPDSLGTHGPPGDSTDMNHWVFWFNDYLGSVLAHGAAGGRHRIVLFKSCFPNSNIADEGVEPGDPFSPERTLANYRAVFRHPEGPGATWTRNGVTYRALEDVFAAHPDVLFVYITSPPRHWAPDDATNDSEARRARRFANWVKREWLSSYREAHAGLRNVAVFDWFDLLAYPDDAPRHPNRLRAEYGGADGDSHPNRTADRRTAAVFATFLDAVVRDFEAQR